jgi:UPF0271 protein
MRVVLDTSALFELEQIPMDWEGFVTDGVLAELERYGDRRVGHLLTRVKVSAATSRTIERVREAARTTGDLSRLSPVDVEVLALALELSATLVTDDYSIQNLAAVLGVPYMPLGTKGITKVVRWKYVCTGCGKVFREQHQECPVCGSPLRTTRKR